MTFVLSSYRRNEDKKLRGSPIMKIFYNKNKKSLSKVELILKNNELDIRFSKVFNVIAPNILKGKTNIKGLKVQLHFFSSIL